MGFRKGFVFSEDLPRRCTDLIESTGPSELACLDTLRHQQLLLQPPEADNAARSLKPEGHSNSSRFGERQSSHCGR